MMRLQRKQRGFMQTVDWRGDTARSRTHAQTATQSISQSLFDEPRITTRLGERNGEIAHSLDRLPKRIHIVRTPQLEFERWPPYSPTPPLRRAGP